MKRLDARSRNLAISDQFVEVGHHFGFGQNREIAGPTPFQVDASEALAIEGTMLGGVTQYVPQAPLLERLQALRAGQRQEFQLNDFSQE